MRLHEISSPTIFHFASTKSHRNGQFIAVIGHVHPLGALLEGRLESTRPEGYLPRQKSLYLHTTPAVSGDYVYEVIPLDRVERYHGAWLRKLRQANVNSVGEIDQLCHAYWSRQECPEAREEPWEYRTLRAKIINRVAGSAPTRLPNS